MINNNLEGKRKEGRLKLAALFPVLIGVSLLIRKSDRDSYVAVRMGDHIAADSKLNGEFMGSGNFA